MNERTHNTHNTLRRANGADGKGFKVEEEKNFALTVIAILKKWDFLNWEIIFEAEFGNRINFHEFALNVNCVPEAKCNNVQSQWTCPWADLASRRRLKLDCLRQLCDIWRLYSHAGSTNFSSHNFQIYCLKYSLRVFEGGQRPTIKKSQVHLLMFFQRLDATETVYKDISIYTWKDRWYLSKSLI